MAICWDIRRESLEEMIVSGGCGIIDEISGTQVGGGMPHSTGLMGPHIVYIQTRYFFNIQTDNLGDNSGM